MYEEQFEKWCARALEHGPDCALINATKTGLRHVKVEQIVVGCHLFKPFNLNSPIDIEFLHFIRGKPEVVMFEDEGDPSVCVTQGDRTYYVYDSGLPLDIDEDYACPIFPYKHFPRNQSKKDWLFTIEPRPLPPALQVGAMFRLYANMAMALGREAGFEFLVNLNMRNVSLQAGKLLSTSVDVRGSRMDFSYGFWGGVVSTGQSFYHPRFRREFSQD